MNDLRRSTRPGDNADGVADGAPIVLLPPGRYLVKFVGWSTCLYLNRQPKVKLQFQVCDAGCHQGAMLERWYNVKALIGQPRNCGRFRYGQRSALFREYCGLAGDVGRWDRLSLSALKPKLLAAQVRTVTTDNRQKQLHPRAHYSVIDSLQLATELRQT